MPGTCDICVNPSTKQKNFSSSSIPLSIGIKNFYTNGNDLTVTYFGDAMETSAGMQKGHKSTFKIHEVLETLRPPMRRRGTEPWSAETASTLFDSRTNRATYNEWLHDEKVFADMLLALRKWGLIFLDQVPKDEEAIVRLAERIGPLRHTFYGRTWDVKDKPDSQNVAYTSTDLELHMDLLYVLAPCLHARPER